MSLPALPILLFDCPCLSKQFPSSNVSMTIKLIWKNPVETHLLCLSELWWLFCVSFTLEMCPSFKKNTHTPSFFVFVLLFFFVTPLFHICVSDNTEWIIMKTQQVMCSGWHVMTLTENNLWSWKSWCLKDYTGDQIIATRKLKAWCQSAWII